MQKEQKNGEVAVSKDKSPAVHSPPRPAGSTISINAQASTGENPVPNPAPANIAPERPTDDQIIAQENLIRYFSKLCSSRFSEWSKRFVCLV